MRHKLEADLNEISAYNTLQINPDDIVGYIIRRSPTSRLHFNVFAVSSDDELLFCAASDMNAETAMCLVDAFNREHCPYVPTPTEAVFIEVGGVEKVYNITATTKD